MSRGREALLYVLALGGCAANSAPVQPVHEPGPATEQAGPIADPAPRCTIEITLFFADREGVAERGCDAVASVTRTVEAQQDVATQAVGLLLAGPTDTEIQAAGVLHTFGKARHTHRPELLDLSAYFTGVEVISGVAYVDFSEDAAAEYLLYDAPCAQATVHAPIAATLRAATGATRVQYRIAGRVLTEESGA